ncbi:adenylate/guanylate cyclase domain-containing protein [Acuticoccus sp. M5D2P5]|uniref:adenylate/guanylate cyclase domain-containing protein n=1 Tax=Acuticoccus kalidii TaxID=2910977 RepID=UPI001F2A0576|nr:adenylate/guanylate cyclase domain-containing protein [Acuticoccus kalidii]MCF3934024.1 adenylate/guanylate cyclase domain-containing protein [Acuticoccus kalidii]
MSNAHASDGVARPPTRLSSLLGRLGWRTAGAAQPYPLLRHFLLIVLPVLALGFTGLLMASALALSTVAERVYEADAAGRHVSMAAIVGAAAPEALAAIASGDFPEPADTARTKALLAEKAEMFGLTCVALIATRGTSYVNEGPACPSLDTERRKDIVTYIARELSTPEARLFKAIEDPVPAWLVASIAPSDRGAVVIATVQASAPLDNVIGASINAWIGGLGLALIVALGVALVLVAQMQNEIDRRSETLSFARDRIARFVSRHVRTSALGAERARRSESTVLFMDIRDFSSFAESESPDETAALVATIAGIGFAAVQAHGGDVDRLIGDGLIARFDGPDRVDRAFTAATEILRRIAAARTARAVGIGLTDGEVVEATIAVGDRADATILGRTVNLSARLCSTAQAGEIVAAATLTPPRTCALLDVGTETLTPKGHRQPVTARRLRLTSASAVLRTPTARVAARSRSQPA